jgi:hypothetical protein
MITNPNLTFAQLKEIMGSDSRICATCKTQVEDLESYAEGGMRTTIIGLRQMNHDPEVMTIQVDYSEFDEYNKKFESANYYDKNGEATMTAREKGQYKVKDELYVMADGLVGEFFAFSSNDQFSIFTEFANDANSGESYVSWLENTVLKLRSQ